MKSQWQHCRPLCRLQCLTSGVDTLLQLWPVNKRPLTPCDFCLQALVHLYLTKCIKGLLFRPFFPSFVSMINDFLQHSCSLYLNYQCPWRPFFLLHCKHTKVRVHFALKEQTWRGQQRLFVLVNRYERYTQKFFFYPQWHVWPSDDGLAPLEWPPLSFIRLKGLWSASFL